MDVMLPVFLDPLVLLVVSSGRTGCMLSSTSGLQAISGGSAGTLLLGKLVWRSETCLPLALWLHVALVVCLGLGLLADAGPLRSSSPLMLVGLWSACIFDDCCVVGLNGLVAR